MCSPWATSWPVAEKRAQEKSLRSLMFGEKLDLRSTTPISSAIEMSEFLRISNETESSNSGLSRDTRLSPDVCWASIAVGMLGVFCPRFCQAPLARVWSYGRMVSENCLLGILESRACGGEESLAAVHHLQGRG